MNISTHQFFHPCNWYYSGRSIGTKLRITKINPKQHHKHFMKICIPENYPLYGIHCIACILGSLCLRIKFYYDYNYSTISVLKMQQ